MSNIAGKYVSIPTGADVVKVKNAIEEIANALTLIEAQREHIKDVKAMLKEDYEMTPKSVNLLAKLHVKGEADEYFGELEELSDLYQTIF